MSPSLDLINFLQWLTEFRIKVNLLSKKIERRNSLMKEMTGQVCGKGHRTSMLFLGTPFSLHHHIFTNPKALSTPPFLDFYGGLIT